MKIRFLLVVTVAMSLLVGCAAMLSSFTTRTVDAGTCKMEVMDDRDNPDLYADFFYYWSGPCSDGYAHGRGYQIEYIKTGVTEIHNVVADRGKATGTSLSFQNMSDDNWWQLHENFENGISVSNVNGVEKEHIRRAQLPVGFQNTLNEFARIHPDILAAASVSTQQTVQEETSGKHTSAQANTNNSSSNGFSTFIGMLGTAAKGVGIAGGRSATSYQATGNALMMAGGAPNNNSAKANKPGQTADATCLKLESAGRDTLTIGDSQRVVLRNACSYSIAGAFCIRQQDNALLNTNNLCSRGAGASYTFKPGQTVEVTSQTKSGSKVDVITAACLSPSEIEVVRYGVPIQYRCVISPPTAAGIR